MSRGPANEINDLGPDSLSFQMNLLNAVSRTTPFPSKCCSAHGRLAIASAGCPHAPLPLVLAPLTRIAHSI